MTPKQKKGSELVTLHSTVGAFDRWLQSIQAIGVYEARLHVTEDGLRVQARDASNVAMVRARYPDDATRGYEPAGDPAEVGINIPWFHTVLDGWDPEAALEIEIHDHRIWLTEIGSGHDTTFNESTIDAGYVRDDPPFQSVADHDYDYEAVVSEVDGFRLAVRSADQVADSLKVIPRDGAVLVKADGDTSHVTAEIKATTHDTDAFDDAHGCHLSTDYLLDICEAIEAVDPPNNLVLAWSDKDPLYLNSNGARSDWRCCVEWALAPRIPAGSGVDT